MFFPELAIWGWNDFPGLFNAVVFGARWPPELLELLWLVSLLAPMIRVPPTTARWLTALGLFWWKLVTGLWKPVEPTADWYIWGFVRSCCSTFPLACELLVEAAASTLLEIAAFVLLETEVLPLLLPKSLELTCDFRDCWVWMLCVTILPLMP